MFSDMSRVTAVCSSTAAAIPGEISLILNTAVAMKEVGTRSIKKVPALRGRTVKTAPVEDNLDGTTATLLQYQSTGSDGHFVVFDVPAAQIQSAKFLATLADTGTATVVVAP